MENNDEKKNSNNQKMESDNEITEELYEDAREDKINEMAILKEAFENERLKTAEYKNNYIRLLAEFDNFKKRQEKDRESLNDFFMMNFFKEIIPVLEGFEKATKIESDNVEYSKGMKMIFKNLNEVLEKYGLKKQKALNEKFDPLYFEATGFIVSDKEEGLILQVVREGYIFNGKIIRPAQVLISKKIEKLELELKEK